MAALSIEAGVDVGVYQQAEKRSVLVNILDLRNQILSFRKGYHFMRLNQLPGA